MAANQTQHIGIIACSAPGAALCYETICTEAAELLGKHRNPEISLHCPDFAGHVRCLEGRDWQGLADLLLLSARKLKDSGADFLVCPDNTAHVVYDLVAKSLPIPWLHIADGVAAQAKRMMFRKLGVLGTSYFLTSPVLTDRLLPAGFELALPSASEREQLDQLIFNDLVRGRVTDAGRRIVESIIERLRADHLCEGVVLACTELPLAVSPHRSALPLLDSTRLLARSALERAASLAVAG